MGMGHEAEGQDSFLVAFHNLPQCSRRAWWQQENGETTRTRRGQESRLRQTCVWIPPLASHCTPLPFGPKSVFLSIAFSKGCEWDVGGNQGDFWSCRHMKGYVLPVRWSEHLLPRPFSPTLHIWGSNRAYQGSPSVPYYLLKRPRHAQRPHAPSSQPRLYWGLIEPLHTSTSWSRCPPSLPPEDAGIIPTVSTGASTVWAAAEKDNHCLLFRLSHLGSLLDPARTENKTWR